MADSKSRRTPRDASVAPRRQKLIYRLLLAAAVPLTGLALVAAAAPEKGAKPQAVLAAAPAQTDGPLTLNEGESVAILGAGIADRMQHDGWFESLVHAKFPKHSLTFRNLAVAGDEVTTWHRSENFGSRDEWLTKVKADVILAFYGFNESFRGDAGLAQFRSDLEKFIKDARKQSYNGKSASRLVLVSPVAAERHRDPNFPDPAPINANLEKYVAAMAEVAKANGVQFVDLFAPSKELYAQAAAKGESLTAQGFHLTDEGNRRIAPILYRATFGESAPETDLAKIRAAVNEKNSQWHARYRTVDGYNVYGGRSELAYQPGKGGFIKNREAPKPYVSNYHVMQQEMSQRDVMTANRDRRVWAVAQGGDLKVVDDNLPPVTKVESNKPGEKPGGAHTFKSGEEAIKDMKVPANCKVNLFADEKQFPELVNPVQMAWDTKGRLWVAAWRTYPERTPTDTVGDSLIVLEDTDADGKADKCTTFLGNLNCPTGFQFYKDGVLLMQAPDLWFVRDTDGDGKGDWKERVLMGLDSADSHHTTNAMCLEPGGATYLSDGVFHRTQVETEKGVVRNADGAIYRFEPRSGKFEKYVVYGFANPHGRVFDYWGNDIITDATGNNNYFAPAFSGRLDNGKHANMKAFWDRPSRPCPGTAILSSRHFPDDFNGNFLNLNVISIQGIFRVKMSEEGSGLKGETLEHLVTSTDPNFRPSAAQVGPDGAVYFLDWHKPLIGHMQHHLRDPNRDSDHGRVYRITYEGRPLLKQPKIDGQPIEALLDVLKTPEDDVRTLAKVELGKHDAAKVIPAVKKWAAALDKSDKEYEHHMAEALWVHQWMNVVDVDLLKRQLRSPSHNARAAATRVLCYWRDRVPEALALLKVQANDESPRVRLEAVRAASYFDGNDAKEAMLVAYEVLKKQTDYYIDYTMKETLKQLQTLVKEPVVPADPTIAAVVLKSLPDAKLLDLKPTEPALLARLERKTIELNTRFDGIGALAKMHNRSVPAELLASVKWLDERGASAAAADLAKVVPALKREELAAMRGDLLALAAAGKQSGVRQFAWATVVSIDADANKTWADAKAPVQKQDLFDGLALLLDSSLREKFQPVITGVVADSKAPANVRTAALRALPLTGQEFAKANFALLANLLKDGKDRSTAAKAIMSFPRESWDKASSGQAAEAILEWAKTVPDNRRTAQEFIETVQVGNELAGQLPAADATRVRKALRGLGVSVFVVRAVREQMRYDTTRLVVEAGKPFEIIFENDDFMPHNLVVVQPGARQPVAQTGEKLPPDKLDNKGRAYVPDKDKRVIDATKLIEAGQKQTLKLTAPNKPGDYEYVCTFPGHWQVMWGRLVVTKDVDDYLRKHPDAGPLPVSGAAAVHQHGAH